MSQSFLLKITLPYSLFWSACVSPLSFPLLCLNKSWLINQAFLCINDEDLWQAVWCCCLHAVHWNLGTANYLQITVSGARQRCRFWAGEIVHKMLSKGFIWINLILKDWIIMCLLHLTQMVETLVLFTPVHKVLNLTKAIWQFSTAKLNFSFLQGLCTTSFLFDLCRVLFLGSFCLVVGILTSISIGICAGSFGSSFLQKALLGR